MFLSNHKGESITVLPSKSNNHSNRKFIMEEKIHEKVPESGENALGDTDLGTTKRISIDTLPADALTLVMGHCPDLDTLRNLASTSPALRKAIYQHNLSCDSCRSPFFADDSLKASPHTKAFSCSVCHQRFCGFTLFDYDRRKCKPQVCDGCGTIECSKCMEAHTTDEQADGYGTENYCAICQESFEFGMGGC